MAKTKIRIGSGKFKTYKNGNIAHQLRTSSGWKTVKVAKRPSKSK